MIFFVFQTRSTGPTERTLPLLMLRSSSLCCSGRILWSGWARVRRTQLSRSLCCTVARSSESLQSGGGGGGGAVGIEVIQNCAAPPLDCSPLPTDQLQLYSPRPAIPAQCVMGHLGAGAHSTVKKMSLTWEIRDTDVGGEAGGCTSSFIWILLTVSHMGLQLLPQRSRAGNGAA